MTGFEVQKKILIFTAGFGEGHNTAARNVRDAIEHVSGADAHVEVLDLFDECYGRVNDFFRSMYITAINKSPRLWQGFYNILDNTDVMQSNLMTLSRMRESLKSLIHELEPDAVCSTYPVYNYLLNEIYQDPEGARPRNFSQITIVTDSISVNSIWYKTPSDYYLVPNQETADVLVSEGIDSQRTRVFGFPVQLEFITEPNHIKEEEYNSEKTRAKILYIINSAKKKAPKLLSKLLTNKKIEVTVCVGRDKKLRHEIVKLINSMGKDAEERANVIGWTDKMPELLMSHHLVISKAGGATVQESIAAECPMIVNQIVPGQEEGNYELLRRNDCGTLASKPSEVADIVAKAFADNAKIWRTWKRHLSVISRPDSQIKMAEFVLEQAVPDNLPPSSISNKKPKGKAASTHPVKKNVSIDDNQKQLLMCDLHSHTTFSDGKLPLREVVDFYGQRGFDVMAITDHICDYKKVFGKICDWTGLVLPYEQVDEYFEKIAKEKERAWKKYSMIVMTGLEFNKDGLRPKTSAHLLGVDLKKPIDPSLSIKQIIAEIHLQGGLAIAAHPHRMKSVWGKDTLFLWDNQEEFMPLIDAWEVGNRDDFFNPVGLKKMPFIASSDFHKPKHIRSWKTMLFCEKEPEAIKQCIRVNRDVAVTLYRDHLFGDINVSSGIGMHQGVMKINDWAKSQVAIATASLNQVAAH
ncbi:MAG: PHP domain-containing protein [Verrucomicrobiota bacterium]